MFVTRRPRTIAANNIMHGDFIVGLEVIDSFAFGGKVFFLMEDGNTFGFPAEERVDVEFSE